MSAAFLALLWKDIKIFLADRKAVIMTIAGPIVIASFFGYVFSPRGSAETATIAVLVADQDNSAISRAIVANLAKEKSLRIESAAIEDARARVRRGNAAAAISIPKGFGDAAAQALFRGEGKPELTVLTDPSRGAEAGMVKGILQGSVMQAVTQEAMAGPGSRTVLDRSLSDIESNSSMPAEERRSLIDLLGSVRRWNDFNSSRPPGSGLSSGGLTIPFTTREEAITARRGSQYNAYAHAFAGMAVQFILFLGIDVGVGLLYMRKQGLWRRLRAAPLSKTVLLSSRAASTAVISMFVLFLVFAFARIVFDVRFEGSFAGFVILCLAFSLMTAAFGILIAALGNTPEAARGIAILATLLMVMLGGAWMPAFLFPQWLQKATLFIPTRWAVDGLDAVTWRGLGAASILPAVAVLLGCAVLFGLVSVWRFRWESD